MPGTFDGRSRTSEERETERERDRETEKKKKKIRTEYGALWFCSLIFASILMRALSGSKRIQAAGPELASSSSTVWKLAPESPSMSLPSRNVYLSINSEVL